MATRRGPRFKECRWLGVNTCGHPKAMKRMDSVAARSRRKPTEYRIQMVEKQKIKAYYGIFEKQLLRYYKDARKSKEKTGDALMKTLECRLDNLVYRAGFGNSIRMSRQLVTHGHIRVNGKKIDIPSYQVKVGDVITLKEKSRKVEPFVENFKEMGGFNLPYLEVDQEAWSATLSRLPEREELPVEINDQLVIEFFSR
ncbi:MAG: 30S ribosomal protein S4 [Eubacteriales bacterium]|nr:30S ribosomal protein S4 [Eubacteriales bacterium]